MFGIRTGVERIPRQFDIRGKRALSLGGALESSVESIAVLNLGLRNGTCTQDRSNNRSPKVSPFRYRNEIRSRFRSGTLRLGSGRSQPSLRKLLRSELGHFALPLGLAIAIFVTSVIALICLNSRWRAQMRTQIRLDQCVARTSFDLRDYLEALDSSNQRIEGLRASLLAARLQPELIPPLSIALRAQVKLQDLQKALWVKQRVTWTVQKGCGSLLDSASPLPTPKFFRPPDDSLGPQTLLWAGSPPRSYWIQVDHYPRHAAAELRSLNENPRTIGKWKVAWAIPH